MSNANKEPVSTINLGCVDVSCYQLNNWFVTKLIKQAVHNNKTVYQINKEGFLNISKDEFVKKVGNLKLAYVNNDRDYTYINNDAVLTIDVEFDSESKADIYLITTNEKLYKAFYILAKEHIESTKANTVSVLASSSDGFYLSSVGKINNSLIKENYSKEVIKQFDYVVEDFQSNDPHGRLVIVSGEPGTGKTYWVKGLISKLQDVTVILIPPNMITQIDGPSLIPTFIEHRRRKNTSIVLVLEDADSCLAPRAADNMSAISSLLNCADGILGSMLDIRIIATTNQKTEDFDPALVRPGRLTDRVKIDALSADDATIIYKRLTGDETFRYEEPKTLASVYVDADVNTGGKVKGDKTRKENKTKLLISKKSKMGFDI